MRLGMVKALGTELLRGGLSYTLESVDIKLNSHLHEDITVRDTSHLPVVLTNLPANVSHEIAREAGTRLVSKVGASLVYDTSEAPTFETRRVPASPRVTTATSTFPSLTVISSEAWIRCGATVIATSARGTGSANRSAATPSGTAPPSTVCPWSSACASPYFMTSAWSIARPISGTSGSMPTTGAWACACFCPSARCGLTTAFPSTTLPEKLGPANSSSAPVTGTTFEFSPDLSL